MSKDTGHPSRRAQYCLCGERRGEMVRCAAGISGCNGYFHPACCGLESDFVSFGVSSVGSSETSGGAVGDLLYYCSMCVAAYVVAPPPLLPVPLLPIAPISNVDEASLTSDEDKAIGEPEAGVAHGADHESTKECDSGDVVDGGLSKNSEDADEVKGGGEEDEIDCDPDSGWGGLLTSLARNLLVYGADGEAMSPRELWPPPEEWKELPEQSFDHFGVGSESSTGNEAPLRRTLLRGTSDGRSDNNDDNNDVDDGNTHAPGHHEPQQRRTATRSTRAHAASDAATSSASKDISDDVTHRDFELPPAVRWEVLQRRYSEMASATGAAEAGSDNRTSSHSNSRGGGGAGNQRSASVVNAASNSSGSGSSSSLLDGFVQRGGVGGQPGLDPDKPLGARGLSFAAQCAVLREVFEDAMAAMPEQPLKAPPHDPILDSCLAPRGVPSSTADADAASTAAAVDGVRSATLLSDSASAAPNSQDPSVEAPEKAEGKSLAERTRARRQRRHFRAVRRAQWDAKLDAKARKWLAKGLAELEDMEGLLAAIRFVVKGAERLNTLVTVKI